MNSLVTMGMFPDYFEGPDPSVSGGGAILVKEDIKPVINVKLIDPKKVNKKIINIITKLIENE